MVKIVYKDHIWNLRDSEWREFDKLRLKYSKAAMSDNWNSYADIEYEMIEYLDKLISSKKSQGMVEQVIGFN